MYNPKTTTVLLVIALTTAITSLTAGDVSEIVGQDDILTWTGHSDTDPRGLEALPGGLYAYFEDDGSAGSAQDSVIVFDPTEVGNDRFSVLVDENTLESLCPQKVYGAHVSDMVRDAAGNLYLAVTGIWNSKSIRDNFIVRVPYDGSGYGTPERIVDIPDGGFDGSSRTYHRVAVLGDDLWILYDNLDSADDDTDNGIYHFDMTTTLPGGTADLTLVTTLFDAAQAMSDPPSAGQDFGLWQIRVNSDGDLFGFVYENGGGMTGDLLRIDTATGTSDVFLTQEGAESLTGINNIFTEETNLAIEQGTDHFFVMETGTGTEEREIVFELTEDGTLVGQHAHHYQIEDAVPDINDSLSTVASNALTVAPDGTVVAFFTLDDDVSMVSIDPDTACDHGLSYIWPTGDTAPPTEMSSGYGPRQLVSGGYRYDFHRGIDIDMTIGSPLYAVADGVVEKAGTVSGFLEPMVAIRHGDCAPYVYSYYLHLDSASVKAGDPVSQGDEIGLSGESASGYDHLHFELRVGGMWQAHCQNPMEVLPFTDAAPSGPTLIGGNDSASGHVLYYEITTPRQQADHTVLDVSWGSDSGSWDWHASNLANGPDFPEGMDHPVIDLDNGITGVAIAEHVNSSTTNAVRSLAVSGLDTTGASGSVSVTDLAGTTATTNVDLTGLPDLSLTPEVTASGSPGDVIALDFTLTNDGGSSVNVDLSAVSSAANTISLNQTAVLLTPGSSTTVTVTVTLDATHPVGVGDGIVLTADASSSLPMVAVGKITTQ